VSTAPAPPQAEQRPPASDRGDRLHQRSPHPRLRAELLATCLAAGQLLEALKSKATKRGVENLEELGRSKALKGDVRSVQAACRLGGVRRVKVETVERLCRKVLGVDPRSLYGEGFDKAWEHRGKRVNERV
jgi:hypothetical protein